MRKLLLSSLFISLFSLFTNNAFSLYNAAGEITYTNVGGNNYEVVFTRYHECSNSIDGSVFINFICETDTSLNFFESIPLLYLPPKNASLNCTVSPGSCSGGNYYGVRKYIYKKTVTIPSCNKWKLKLSRLGNCRVNHNTTVDSLRCFYTDANLNNSNNIQNSSVQFSIDPVHIILNNQEYTIYQGATDPDGDSLVFSFYTPRNNDTIDVAYFSPWSASNFFTTTAAGISFDSTNGNITFTPNHSSNNRFSTTTGIKVEEYRNINGQMTLVGITRRDIDINIIPSNFHAPILSGIDTKLSTSYNPNDSIYQIGVPINLTPISFNIHGFDLDTFNINNTGNPERFSVSWDSSIASASFTAYNNGTDSAYANFTWQPSNSDIGKKKCFFATVKDESCPYNFKNDFKYCILVKPSNVGIAPSLDDGKLSVAQNHPNPVHNITMIDINLPKFANVVLEVRNMLGQTVFEKKYGNLSSGSHDIQLNLTNLKAGIYFYTVYADQDSKTRKLIVE